MPMHIKHVKHDFEPQIQEVNKDREKSIEVEESNGFEPEMVGKVSIKQYKSTWRRFINEMGIPNATRCF